MDEVTVRVETPPNYDVRRRATELLISREPCPWCVAEAGELCHDRYPGLDGGPRRGWEATHLGRFPAGVSAVEYLAQNGQA